MGKARDIAGDGTADLHRGALAAGRAARQMRERGAHKREDGHARMDESCAQGGVDDQIVAAFGGETVVLVDPRGGHAHDGEQGVDPHMALAIIGRNIQRGQKRPSGNAHGERNDNDEREQFGAREHVVGIAARVGGQELFGAGELVATADDQVGRREGPAVCVLTGVIRRVECIFTFIDKSHNVLFIVAMHAL